MLRVPPKPFLHRVHFHAAVVFGNDDVEVLHARLPRRKVPPNTDARGAATACRVWAMLPRLAVAARGATSPRRPRASSQSHGFSCPRLAGRAPSSHCPAPQFESGLYATPRSRLMYSI